MSDLIQGLISQVGSQAVSSLTQSLGEDESKIQTATQMAIPALMKALADKSQDESAAEELSNSLDEDQGGILDNISDFLQGEESESLGTGILSNLLGDSLGSVVSNISSASGLSQGGTMSLIAKLAPIVMSFLGKTKQDQGLNAGSIASMLFSATSGLDTSSSGLAGMVGGFLDKDGDGNVKDDLLSMGGSMLKGFFK